MASSGWQFPTRAAATKHRFRRIHSLNKTTNRSVVSALGKLRQPGLCILPSMRW